MKVIRVLSILTVGMYLTHGLYAGPQLTEDKRGVVLHLPTQISKSVDARASKADKDFRKVIEKACKEKGDKGVVSLFCLLFREMDDGKLDALGVARLAFCLQCINKFNIPLPVPTEEHYECAVDPVLYDGRIYGASISVVSEYKDQLYALRTVNVSE
jgi:hypothetical protein